MKFSLNKTMFLPMVFSASVISAVAEELGQDLEKAKYVEDEVIVRFKTDSVQAQDIYDLQNKFSISSVRKLSGIGMQLWKVSGDTKNVIEQLNHNNSVAYAEPNFFIKLQATPNDQYLTKLWGLDNSDAIEAWQSIDNSKDTVIAVIDTGVDYTHPDLAANMWKNKGEIPDNGIDDDGNGYIDDVYGYDFHNNDGDPFDDNYHGTHIAGTIAAVGNNDKGIIGVNPNGKIMALKFLDAEGVGTLSNVIKAIDYAANNVLANNDIVMLQSKNWYEMDLRLSQGNTNQPAIINIKNLVK